MANAGTFKKGEKKPNQGKRGPNKATLQVREAIAIFAEANVDRLQGWLDEIASNDKQGPAVAARLYLDLLEYHVPKLARTEMKHEGEVGLTVNILKFSADNNPPK